MPNITINVRPSTGQLFQVDLDSDSTTVESLKQLIAEKMGNIEAANLKLVFSGRILKNEDLCSQCSKFSVLFLSYYSFVYLTVFVYLELATGCTVHVVRSGVNKTPANTAPTTPKTSNATTPTPVAHSEPIPPIPPTPSPSTLTGLGASPFGDMQMPNMDPEVMRQMMDSPFMQNIMGNTGLCPFLSSL